MMLPSSFSKRSTIYILFNWRILVASFLVVLLLIFLSKRNQPAPIAEPKQQAFWPVESIDTMKYSRDLAGQKVNDPSYVPEIDTQVKNIKDTGANYVAIDTPYDEQFLPYLKEWIAAARKYNLHVWFRGNWSAWEGWFGIPQKMTTEEHIQKSVSFIKQHPDLFEDHDAFTACPECENGAAGDPRRTGRVDEYRSFLISEALQTNDAFKSIHKNVYTNWLSMNKDVADLIMDKETVSKIGGVIVIDHYVGDPQKLAADVNKLGQDRGAKIILGEYGAPILDINGNLTDDQQAEWLNSALRELTKSKYLIGLNYWTNKGGSTAVWRDDNSAKPAVAVVNKFYAPIVIYGEVQDSYGKSLDGVQISAGGQSTVSQKGVYNLVLLENSDIQFSKQGFTAVTYTVDTTSSKYIHQDVVMQNLNQSIWNKLLNLF